jgi:hypothetical protein
MSPITFDYRHKSSLLDCDLFFLADSVISVVYMIMLIPDKSNKLCLYTLFHLWKMLLLVCLDHCAILLVHVTVAVLYCIFALVTQVFCYYLVAF